MSTVVAVPYLVPERGRVVAEAWQYLVRGEWAELPDRVPEWDYATVLRLRRRVMVNLGDVASDCGLGSNARVGLAVTWRSSATNRRWTSEPLVLTGSGALLELGPSGDEMGGVLHLRTELLLLDRGANANALAARRPGSVLWSDTQSAHLEGSSALFPVEMADFERAGIGPLRAGWYLELDTSSLEAATLGTVRLMVNTRHERVAKAAGVPDSDDVSRAIISAMRCDVMRQLIEAALDADEFDDQREYPAGSLGASLKSVLRLAFPTDRVGTVRSLRKSYRADFEMQIQAAAGLFSV